MKRLIFLALTSLFLSVPLFAQQEEDTENGVVSLAGREGYAIQTKSGDFVFKPYMMVQTAGHYNWYDDEGLDKAYNQDNIMNSGFSIPYAIIGFTGKAFDKVTFNLSINASASGARILQQAWFDVRLNDAMALRTGKFKTPFQNGFLTTLGNTLMPCVPSSMTTTVIMPYVLNAVTPSIMTGWDIGVELHGLLGGKFGYEVGLWNGTGSSTNAATKTVSDDWHIPSLLYAGRLSYMPLGLMPSTQGDPNRLNDNRILLAASGSVNVESESESTNDTRAGLEAAWLYRRLYLSAEAYYMHIGFTDRQKIDDTFDYWGAYAQCGYFLTDRLQAALRYDFMDRNGMDADGFLNMPAVGFNYFFSSCNLKLQAMYQYIGRTGHKTQLDRDNDDLGLATHSATIQLQYSF
ncbi:MAG: OprO/OprP family phosphate-selective porin [Paludibacteraceae bacterium]|nr:OprO/OprP family phosphate-selective porin [Paludibacteraceae bacterium]